MATTDRKKRSRPNGLPIVHRHAAGIDIGATFHVVAVPADADEDPVRKFNSFTGDLHRLAEWLKRVGITTVAMESTGIYWVPACTGRFGPRIPGCVDRGFRAAWTADSGARDPSSTVTVAWRPRSASAGSLQACIRPTLNRRLQANRKRH
jgi:hypothetical protein